ncbi:MAG TPA: hypothetical protein VNA16_00110 [Abditibacteriaceae bacterium]|nr:hypothetical protein [Abditibacteriaceae bacterium]
MNAPDVEPWQIARAHADVIARLRDIIAELAPHLQRDEDRTVLMHHA